MLRSKFTTFLSAVFVLLCVVTGGVLAKAAVYTNNGGQVNLFHLAGSAIITNNRNWNLGIGTSSPWANLSIQDQVGAPQTQPIFSVSSSTPGVNAFTVYPDGYIQAGPTASRDTAYCTFGKYCFGYFGSDNTLSGVNIEAGNYSSGGSAYGGFTILNNLDDPTGSHYAFFGLTSSNYNDPTFGTSQAFPNQMQLVNSDGQVLIQANFNATTTVPSANSIIFTVNGTTTANEIARITPFGLGIGTTTALAQLQVATSTANATTSVEFGKANQNKGTCTTFFDGAGSAVYMFFPNGSIVPTYTATQPSGCQK